jgi:cell wall-associated NlpC family hydrolase
MASFSTTPIRRPVWRALVSMAMIAFCAAPATAQGVVQAGDTVRPGESPKLEGSSLPATVARYIESQRTSAMAKPVEPARPFSVWSASVHSLRDSILVSIARTQIGTRYVRGGEAPERGFDCSGLVRYVLAGFHVPLPRTAAEQALTGLSVGQDTTQLRPGDLLTFGKPKRGVSHIGIYVGNGRFVHASSKAGRVIESNLDRPRSPLIKPWRGTRRVVLDLDDEALLLKGDS